MKKTSATAKKNMIHNSSDSERRSYIKGGQTRRYKFDNLNNLSRILRKYKFELPTISNDGNSLEDI